MAALSGDPAFANFLRLRADALLTDDYYKSDLAWLDFKDPRFDVIFATYETSLDLLTRLLQPSAIIEPKPLMTKSENA
jgi:hypothetical protein